MESSLAILIPVSLVLVFVIGGVLWWSVRSGQFEDLEGEAFRVIMDDDRTPAMSDKKTEQTAEQETPKD
ncbi:cbb3-type cytochrome oxidase assembly protein CcoS [Viridibacterium curvum]|uniref:Cbb3-type cytochrome oxidase assembly protein CcoS n=1 Tax=Viridibacterium curvum TaxID=1101404 RepID=A0ABP9Q6P5_9RHOO